MDEQAPDPQPSRAMVCFLPPFRRGGRGGELTISITLTLIHALFLRFRLLVLTSAFSRTRRAGLDRG